MNKAIFLIDDSLSARELIKEHLKEIGEFDIIEAVDGSEAYQFLSEFSGPIDLILCDQNMPQMLGTELLKEIKKVDRLKTIPFIFVTSQSQESAIKEAMELGATNYLVKPLDAEDFHNALGPILK